MCNGTNLSQPGGRVFQLLGRFDKFRVGPGLACELEECRIKTGSESVGEKAHFRGCFFLG